MRQQVRPTPPRALDIAEELIPPPGPELAGLPPPVRVQSRLFDALVLLVAAREEAETADGGVARSAALSIGRLCRELDALLDHFSS
jgi:hypothetical protein